jgi:hypothetical protein
MAGGAVLGGCGSHLPNYVRTDGGSINSDQEQATLAQCKDEGATAQTHEQAVIDACMARNGYIQHE